MQAPHTPAVPAMPHTPARPDAGGTSPEEAHALQDGGVPARVQARLADWHVQGAQRTDPVRFALIEALARRALRHHGAARALLDARLSALAEDYAALLRARGIPPMPDEGAGLVVGPRGPLGALVDGMAGAAPVQPVRTPAAAAEKPAARGGSTRMRGASAGGRSGAKGTPGSGARAEPAPLPSIDLETVALHTAAAPAASLELSAVRRFRGTWSRLSAEERLRQTFAQVPPQAGPLNALHLLHRALVQMQGLSPQYLQHFVAHVDALLWLEEVHQAAMAPSSARSGRSARAIAARRKGPAKKP